MPAIATHYLFGQEVYRQLIEKNRKDIIAMIRKHRLDYNIGLQGPDPLFYYQPVTKNSVVNYAHAIHKKSGTEFMERAKAHIKKTRDLRAFAYMLGFVCHYALDSEAHPTVNRLGKNSKGHIRIETELDREMLLREILKRDAKHRAERFRLRFFKQPSSEYALIVSDPHKQPKPSVKPEKIRRYRFARYEEGLEKSIDGLYPQISQKQIAKSLEGFVFYNRMLYSPHGVNLSVLQGFEFLTNQLGAFSSIAMTSRRYKEHIAHAKWLIPICDNAVDIATELLINFFDSVRYGTLLSTRFEKTLD